MIMGPVKSVLITGGSGLIGKYLTSLLLAKGNTVSHLSRGRGFPGRVRVYTWNPEIEVLDPAVFNGIDYIIHLAGANIGSKRWTKVRKREITDSRVTSARVIHKTITDNNISLKAFISASAIGYYGAVTTERIFAESNPPSDDFLGTACRLWEESADLFEKSGIRTVKIRTGVVLEKSDSALSKFLGGARFGLFPILGGGKQYFPWIHIADLCNIYLKAIEDEKMTGPYNAVAPDHTDNISFMKTLALVMNKPFISPPVPSLFLRLAMGESSAVALKGSRVSSEKLISSGYKFIFPDLESALKDALK
jgi:uncharacterized protein (TIGR01777 family)